MKSLLLDTLALLWWWADAPELGEYTCRALAQGQHRVYVSAASICEIATAQTLGKLEMRIDEDLGAAVEADGFEPLSISLFHAQAAGRLPPIHHHPFDRILIAQAQASGLTLVTPKDVIHRYGLLCLDARQ